MLHDTAERSAAAGAATVWWKRPYRMVQTNLRQPDALYDQRKLAREIREFGADVLLYNIGGIYAFYPTKLKLHAVNPYMKGDALGDAIEAAHAEGLSLVGRFDMSKATRIAYEAHPDWFVRNAKGDALEYNGTYQACVNGGWYQDYALQIISEALGKYDVDGVFFNMFGYTNFTYSGDYFGICVCNNCRRRFRAMYGRELPLKEDFSDPAYADYLAFKEKTSLELRAKVYRHIKSVNPKVAMTGHRGDSDLIRMEVQRAVDRPQPEWPYQAGEQARWAAAYGQGKTFSSTSTNFVDFAWRFHSETGGYHMLRFAQQLASGATLDYYLLGVIDQDDKTPFADISKLFHWHRKNEAHYTGLRSAARIGLYHSHRNATYRKRTESGDLADKPFRGAYRMLAEARLPFDFVSDDHVGAAGGADILSRYDAVLLANISCLSDEEAQAIDSYVENGGVVVVTGDTGFYNERGAPRDKPALKCLPVEDKPSTRVHMRGSYFRMAEGELPLPLSKLLMLDGRYFVSMPKQGATTLMTLLPPQRFGPPELCFPDVESELPGVISGAYGKGRAIYIPWNPDWQYYRDSLPNHRVLVSDLIERNTPPAPVRLEGKGSLEVTIQEQESTGRLLVHVVNYGGQRNNLYEDAPAVHGLRLGIRGAGKEALALVSEKTIAASADGPSQDGYTWFELPPVEAFEVLSVKREG
jgi:hypothetical protein